ncbi:putative 50S ribosomal protein L30e [Helianthus annuus]|nr:putative 50S ribosomal protein L30e [Helianthus annuus]KAJ0694938.1 putative 50S ribosomal protein L30e [Helianthus annuus]
MRAKNRNKSAVVLPQNSPADHIFRPLNSYEGQSLLHLLSSIQREIKSARLADQSLPHKIWLKQQFSIGVNDVTRVLERMPAVHGSISSPLQKATYCSRNAKQPPLRLQAILIATDCNPRGLTKHLPILASSREVPVIFVKDTTGGSFKLGEIVNLKTAMAIGVKARGNSINKMISEILGGNDCGPANETNEEVFIQNPQALLED